MSDAHAQEREQLREEIEALEAQRYHARVVARIARSPEASEAVTRIDSRLEFCRGRLADLDIAP